MWMYISLGLSLAFTIVLVIMSQKLAKLTKEVNLFKNTLDTVTTPIAVFDESDKYFFANTTAKKIFRLSEEDNYSKLAGQSNNEDLNMLTSKNNLNFKIVVFTDKTELEKLKVLHRKEVQWLTSILDAMKTPISVTNKDMEWTFVNKPVEEMLGVKRSDVVGKKCSNWGANICNTANCGITCLKNGKSITSFEQFGGTFQVYTSYIYDENNEIAGHLEVVSDVSGLANESKNFQEKAYWYESILDAIPFPVSVTDNEQKWTFVNKAVEAMLSTTRDELMGRHCSNWGAAICKTDNCGIACVKRGENRTKFRQAGGTFQVDVAELKSISGQTVGYVELVQDITKLDILDKLNVVLSNVDIASAQVAEGARHIAESSVALADGTTSQASSIDELNVSVEIVSTQIKENATNAMNAKELSNQSKQNALTGKDEMRMMLDSMDAINESSASISKIIKTIEDIAFQTNLLALNAAVEAARAGEHGKGFAVVAEEVRNLAGRSQLSAKETNDLIRDTVSKVEEGTKIATSSATFLNTIVADFEKVSDIIEEIASASSSQLSSIGKITDEISQISSIVQQNSATSEEAAAAAEELASQAEVLKQIVADA